MKMLSKLESTFYSMKQNNYEEATRFRQSLEMLKFFYESQQNQKKTSPSEMNRSHNLN